MKKNQLELYQSAAAAAEKSFELKGHAALSAKVDAFEKSGFDKELDFDLWEQFFVEHTNRCNQLSGKPVPSAQKKQTEAPKLK